MTFKTQFVWDKMGPKSREIMEAHAARIGDDRAARAFEIALCLRTVGDVMCLSVPPNIVHDLFNRLTKALMHEGPSPRHQDIRDMAQFIAEQDPKQ